MKAEVSNPEVSYSNRQPEMEAIPTAAPKRRTVGVLDIPLVFFSPKRLFARVEDVHAYAGPLTLLLTLVTLIGYATVETGLIDAEVNRKIEDRIAELERQQLDVVERSELSKMIEDLRKEGEFMKLLARGQAVVVEPVTALASALFAASLFYGLVALSGRKPEWNTLLTLCVFAGFIDALGLLVRLVLMLKFHTLEVDTSLALVVRKFPPVQGQELVGYHAMAGMLTAFDPFRIWYWLVVIAGLRTTRQLRGWGAWISCTLFWMVAAGARGGMSAAMVAKPPMS